MRELFILIAHLLITLLKRCRRRGVWAVAGSALFVAWDLAFWGVLSR